MKITRENLYEVQLKFRLSESDTSLLKALLDDVDEFNNNKNRLFPIFIGIQDWHDDCDEYPDEYGTFAIYIEYGDMIENISDRLTLRALDDNMCTLCCYFSDSVEMLERIKKGH